MGNVCLLGFRFPIGGLQPASAERGTSGQPRHMSARSVQCQLLAIFLSLPWFAAGARSPCYLT